MNQNKLDEILEKLDDNLSNAPSATTEIGWEKWGEKKQDYLKDATTDLVDLCLGIVGENETLPAGENVNGMKSIHRRRRNKFRAELRAEFKKLLEPNNG